MSSSSCTVGLKHFPHIAIFKMGINEKNYYPTLVGLIPVLLFGHSYIRDRPVIKLKY